MSNLTSILNYMNLSNTRKLKFIMNFSYKPQNFLTLISVIKFVVIFKKTKYSFQRKPIFTIYLTKS